MKSTEYKKWFSDSSVLLVSKDAKSSTIISNNLPKSDARYKEMINIFKNSSICLKSNVCKGISHLRK